MVKQTMDPKEHKNARTPKNPAARVASRKQMRFELPDVWAEAQRVLVLQQEGLTRSPRLEDSDADRNGEA